MSLKKALKDVKRFAEEREWKDYHTPKNLMLGINVEAGELLSLVEWMNDAEVERALKEPDFRKAVRHEIADVLIDVLQLCVTLDIDPLQAFNEKFENSKERFPVEKCKDFDPVDWKLKKVREKKIVKL